MTKALEEVLVEIKETGSVQLRDDMIGEYMPFIIKTVSQFTGRYVQAEHSDEYAVALEAFNEAIDRYDPQRGKFISYAGLVIKSRLKDYKRSVKGRETMEVEASGQIESKGNLEREIILKGEIETLKNELDLYGITFESLERNMPVHTITRENAIEVARFLSSHREAYQQLRKTRQLPRKTIHEHMSVSDKQLKRSRIYIIAVTVVLSEDLGTIREIVQL